MDTVNSTWSYAFSATAAAARDVDACVTLDRAWRFTHVNGQAEKLLQRDRRALLGKNLWDEFPAACGGPIETECHRALERKTPVRFEAHCVPLQRWFDVHAFPSLYGLAVYFRDITATRASEELLRASEERFRLLSNAVSDGIWDWNLLTGELWWSDGFEKLTGFGRSELAPTVASWTRRVHPDDRPRVKRSIRAALSGGTTSWCDEYRFLRKDGTYAIVSDRGSILRGADGKPARMVGGVSDVTEKRAADLAIQRNAQRQGLIAAFGQQALTSTGIDDLIECAAGVVCEGLDVAFSKVVQLAGDGRSHTMRAGRGWRSGWIGRPMFGTHADLARRDVLVSRKPVVVEDFASGTRIAPSDILRAHDIRSAIEVPLGGSGGPYGWIGAYSREPRRFATEDVNFLASLAHTLEAAIERHVNEQKLAYLAQFDALTGLPNRNVFGDRLRQMITQAQRGVGPLGVMLVDLDRFKLINDSSGHGAGDQLLKRVADRLRDCLRPGDTLARLGGDEFAILLTGLAKAEDAGTVAAKIAEAMRRPFDVDGHDRYISASTGIAAFPDDGDCADVLVRNADAAMYRAKERGGDRWEFYRPEMNARAVGRLRMETSLRRLVARGNFENQLVLHYQPKLTVHDRRLTGFEALLRWNHPEDGLVQPAAFIPVLEQTGLIVEVGRWIIGQALADYRAWQAEGLAPPPIAVNVSPVQLRHGDFVDAVRRAIDGSRRPCAALELELTESVVMRNLEHVVPMLHELDAMGVRVAIDDFGTGYSSLAYLAKLPVRALKVDRSFILTMSDAPESMSIVSSIVSLAQSLQRKVVAEGVETEAQETLLRSIGCDEMQGYRFSRPVPADAVAALLRETAHR